MYNIKYYCGMFPITSKSLCETVENSRDIEHAVSNNLGGKALNCEKQKHSCWTENTREGGRYVCIYFSEQKAVSQNRRRTSKLTAHCSRDAGSQTSGLQNWH
jgi:hypothetical protein